MLKNVLAFLAAATLLCGAALPAYAAPSAEPSLLVYDYGDYLTDSEEEDLRERLWDITFTYDMDAVIVFTDDAEGQSSAAYADDFYDYNGFGDDGLILLVNMDDREVWISTCGAAVRTFTDGIIDETTYDLVGYLGDGDYYGAASHFIDRCDYYFSRPAEGLTSSEEEAPRPVIRELTLLDRLFFALPIALPVGLVTGGLVALGMGMSHGSLPGKTAANHNYVKGGRILWSVREDRFLTSHVSKTKIPKDPPSSSGGSSSRSSSSRSHSSTHRSSSGRSHGGGGRKF